MPSNAREREGGRRTQKLRPKNNSMSAIRPSKPSKPPVHLLNIYFLKPSKNVGTSGQETTNFQKLSFLATRDSRRQNSFFDSTATLTRVCRNRREKVSRWPLNEATWHGCERSWSTKESTSTHFSSRCVCVLVRRKLFRHHPQTEMTR